MCLRVRDGSMRWVGRWVLRVSCIFAGLVRMYACTRCLRRGCRNSPQKKKKKKSRAPLVAGWMSCASAGSTYHPIQIMNDDQTAVLSYCRGFRLRPSVHLSGLRDKCILRVPLNRVRWDKSHIDHIDGVRILEAV